MKFCEQPLTCNVYFCVCAYICVCVGCGGVWLEARPDVSVLPGSQPRGYQGNANTLCAQTDKGVTLFRAVTHVTDCIHPLTSASIYLPGVVLSRQYVDLQRLTGQDCADVGPQPGGRTYPGILWAWVGGQRTSCQPWYTHTQWVSSHVKFMNTVLYFALMICTEHMELFSLLPVDGRKLCTGSRDNWMCLWDIESAKCEQRHNISRNLVRIIVWAFCAHNLVRKIV